jgi:osmotically-inducible protein OsmY
MKNKIIISAMLTVSLTLSAVAQTTGGAGAAVSGTAGVSRNTGAGVNTSARATVNSGNNAAINAQGNVDASAQPSGLERRDQLPAGSQNRESLSPGLARGANNSQNTTATNQFVMNSNRFGGTYSNQFGFATNQYISSNGFRAMNNESNNLTPTGRSNWMNQTTASNQFSLTADQAVTVNDRNLLVQIQQSLQATVTTANGTTLPVHFRVDNGVVTVVGTVPTAADAQQIYSVVQRTPGVTRVVNGLQVGDSSGATTVVNGQTSVTTTEAVRPGPSSSYKGSGTYYYDNNPANFGSNMPPTSVPNTPARIYVTPSAVSSNTIIVP